MKTAAKIVKSIFRRKEERQRNFKHITWMQEKIIKHQDDQRIKKLSIDGLIISYKRPYELLHTYKEIFQREIYRFHSEKNNPLIIDCGANIGISVLYYKSIYPDAKVIAFEPDTNNFRLLEENVRQNGYQHVTLHQEAVWTSDGEIIFSANETEASHIAKQGDSGQAVKSIRFNDFLSKQPQIDFLKIDIEGAEWEVITDCAANLSKVNNLFLEYHGKVHETSKLVDLLRFVREAGFSVYIKMAADQLYHPFIDKTLPLPYDVQLNLFCYKD